MARWPTREAVGTDGPGVRRPIAMHEGTRQETDVDEPLYVSIVRIERRGGPMRAAHLPSEDEPVLYGVHGVLRSVFGYSSEWPEHASTLDHVVAAAAGCMAGTFAGALRVRGIDPDGLVAHARGDIELDDNVPVIKRIHVAYDGVEIPDNKRESVARALASHHRACPVTRSIGANMEISTSWL